MRWLHERVEESLEFQRAQLATKIVYQELRPQRGAEEVWCPAGADVDDLTDKVLRMARRRKLPLTHREVAAAIVEGIEVGLFTLRLLPDGSVQWVIAAEPPSVEAERLRRMEERERDRRARYAGQRGRFGGMSDAERQDRVRQGQTTPRAKKSDAPPPAGPASSSNAPDVTGDVTVSTSGFTPQNTSNSSLPSGDISPPSTRAPAPAPPPPPPPGGGGGERQEGGDRSGRAQGGGENKPSDRRQRDRRTPAEPAGPLSVEAFAALAETERAKIVTRAWAESYSVFTLGDEAERRTIGRYAAQAKMGEADLTLIGRHWQADPKAAHALFDGFVGHKVGRVTAMILSVERLLASLAAARAWEKRVLDAGPGPARAAPPSGPPATTAQGSR